MTSSTSLLDTTMSHAMDGFKLENSSLKRNLDDDGELLRSNEVTSMEIHENNENNKILEANFDKQETNEEKEDKIINSDTLEESRTLLNKKDSNNLTSSGNAKSLNVNQSDIRIQEKNIQSNGSQDHSAQYISTQDKSQDDFNDILESPSEEYSQDAGSTSEGSGDEGASEEKTRAFFREGTERCIERFERFDLLGSGTYGMVYKARDKTNNKIYAVKQLKMQNEKEGFPITALREVKILKMMNHPNVVKLHQVIASIEKPNFYMIFEYVDHDLAGLMDAKVDFKMEHLKYLMKQLLEGVAALHSAGVIHRDLKSSNLLISKDGNLKIADFGLAKLMKKGKLTSTVVTRWYRAPELLLGDPHYTNAIDMWSVGCILGEILKKSPLFPGKDELHQMDLIYGLCGNEYWPGCENLENWSKMKPRQQYTRKVRHYFSSFDPDAIDLLEKLLQLDPAKRLTAREALNHPWIVTGNSSNPRDILPDDNCNEHFAKQRRKREQQKHQHKYHHGHPNKMRRIDNSRQAYPQRHYRPNQGHLQRQGGYNNPSGYYHAHTNDYQPNNNRQYGNHY